MMSLATEVPNLEGMALRPPILMKMDLPTPPPPDSKALRMTLTARIHDPTPNYRQKLRIRVKGTQKLMADRKWMSLATSASLIAHRQRMAVVKAVTMMSLVQVVPNREGMALHPPQRHSSIHHPPPRCRQMLRIGVEGKQKQ